MLTQYEKDNTLNEKVGKTYEGKMQLYKTQMANKFLGLSKTGSVVKNPPASARDTRDVGSVPGLGRSPGEGNGNPFQYSYLGNPMNRSSWQARVLGFVKAKHDLVTKQQ